MKKKIQKVSKQETAVSGLVLLVIAAIATGVFISQFQFNPAIISHHDLAATQERVEDNVLPLDQDSLISLPPGMKPLTPPEVFTPETLYEKINGKAELYLSAGFNRLRCQRMHPEQNPELWMEAFVYEMETTSNAFSVFSMQRRDDGTPTDLSDFSYQTENALFLAHGSYYLEIIGSQATPEMRQLMTKFSKHFIQKTISGGKTLSEFSLFPDACSDQTQMSVIPSSAFGFDKLDNVYTAQCTVNQKTTMAFLSNRGSAENARNLAIAYGTFLKTFGGTEIPLAEQQGDARLIEIFGTYELIFTAGSYLCGVHEAETQEQAMSVAALLSTGVGEASK